LIFGRKLLFVEGSKESNENCRIGFQEESYSISFKDLVRTAVFVVGQPRTQHDYHHDTKVKPEATTAVIELLMMGGKTPETC
jgi:hypothetical protein